MPGAHRKDDSRFCGAKTIVQGQSTVYVNGNLWAVEDDPNDHGRGNLISVVGSTVKINGKKVIVALGDKATSDNKDHNPNETKPKGHSDNVNCYG